MASGFSVSTLTDYVDQSSQELIAATQFKAETAAMMNIQTGIKSAAALQILTVDPIPQDGSACTFTASGGVTFTQRNITVKAVAFQDKFCLKNLNAKWTQLLLKAGSDYTEADIPAKIVDEITKKIQSRLETCDWQGDTTSGSSYLNVYDGLIKIIAAASGIVTATASTYNTANCRTIVANIISNIPAALKGDPEVKVFMGYDAVEVYRQKLMNDNLYHVAVGSGSQKGIMAEGSVHEIVPVHGLDGLYSTATQECIFAMKPSNVYLGCDMENEEEAYKLFTFGDGTSNVGYDVQLKRGWNVAIPSEIVMYANS